MANSKNDNLFYKLYSKPNDISNSGFVCNSAVDENDTSFDISGSEGQITDSNGDTLESIDLAQIHADGITEYYNETKIIGPQSAYLLQGNIVGETYAAQFFAIPYQIWSVAGYEPFVNIRCCVHYVECSKLQCVSIDTYKLRTEPGDVCELIQAKLNEAGCKVAVSIRNMEMCNCERSDCNKASGDYLVFQSTVEGYQFFVHHVVISAIDQTYENFNKTWADYTESPFTQAVFSFENIIDLIRNSAPRKVGKWNRPDYTQVPCDLYKFFVSIIPLAVTQKDVFTRNYNALKKFAEFFDDEGKLIERYQMMFITTANLYNDIYSYYFGHEGSICTVYNIHDILSMLGAVSAYMNESNVSGPYEMIEDYEKRLYPQKYPNGAFRGIVLIPDWPGDSDDYEALKLNHVADHIVVEEKIDVPEDMHIEGYICNECKDVFIKHLAEVQVNTLLQSELEVYNECGCCKPVRKVVSNSTMNNCFEDTLWTSKLHEPIDTSVVPDGGGWSSGTEYQDTSDVWSDTKTHKEHHKENHTDYSIDYIDEYRVSPKYEWLGHIPGRLPEKMENPHMHRVGLYRYMQHLNENEGWLNVGQGYMIIGPKDDYQSHKKNLQSSVLLYNPNDVPIRVKFMVFS